MIKSLKKKNTDRGMSKAEKVFHKMNDTYLNKMKEESRSLAYKSSKDRLKKLYKLFVSTEDRLEKY